MDSTLTLSYREEFTRIAQRQREETFYALDERTATHEKAVRKRDKKFEELTDTLLASDANVKAFDATLDRDDTATVKALMENEDKIQANDLKLRQTLASAYTLPDGTRLFETADGTHVFDEKGAERADIDPGLIGPGHPSFETFSSYQSNETVLNGERQTLTTYQQELDQARDTAAKPGLTADALQDLQKKLAADMPDAVKRDLPQPSGDPDGPAATTAPNGAAMRIGNLSMPSL